jgi:hypothetical protein
MFDFGLINYLIRLKIDKIVLVSVSQLKMVGNFIDKIGGRTSNALKGIKNSVVFEQFYSDIKEIKNKMSNIEKSKLISKCCFKNICFE